MGLWCKFMCYVLMLLKMFQWLFSKKTRRVNDLCSRLSLVINYSYIKSLKRMCVFIMDLNFSHKYLDVSCINDS